MFILCTELIESNYKASRAYFAMSGNFFPGSNKFESNRQKCRFLEFELLEKVLNIVSTKKTYDVSIEGNVINGYIQNLSRQPVGIHMYTQEQIFLLKHFTF